jgi:peptidoglycan-N-acetylglucosamine deacetylase
MLPALIGITAAVAATAAGYQSMAPTGQWYGRTFCGGSAGSSEIALTRIALTYDDGPNDPHTLKLLDVLAKHNVHATFFMIGRYVQQRPDIARAVAQAGHVVGNHTFTHPLLIFKSQLETRTELLDCRSALHDAIGGHSSLFRPPWGGRRPATLRIARDLRMETVMWNLPSRDWKNLPAAAIEKNIARRVRGGDLILLHDGSHRAMGADRAQTVIATDNLIRRYKDEGYEFATVEELRTVSQQPLTSG